MILNDAIDEPSTRVPSRSRHPAVDQTRSRAPRSAAATMESHNAGRMINRLTRRHPGRRAAHRRTRPSFVIGASVADARLRPRPGTGQESPWGRDDRPTTRSRQPSRRPDEPARRRWRNECIEGSVRHERRLAHMVRRAPEDRECRRSVRPPDAPSCLSRRAGYVALFHARAYRKHEAGSLAVLRCQLLPRKDDRQLPGNRHGPRRDYGLVGRRLPSLSTCQPISTSACSRSSMARERIPRQHRHSAPAHRTPERTEVSSTHPMPN